MTSAARQASRHDMSVAWQSSSYCQWSMVSCRDYWTSAAMLTSSIEVVNVVQGLLGFSSQAGFIKDRYDCDLTHLQREVYSNSTSDSTSTV